MEYEGEAIGVYKEEDGTSPFGFGALSPSGLPARVESGRKKLGLPCHGSRFDFYGNLIDNPAQEGLQHA